MFKRRKLGELAHARSGDKGNNVNIGVIAKDTKSYEILKKQLTADKVRQYFSVFCRGDVVRYEMPNIKALNFVLKDSLAGGGTTSLRLDSQGKTLGVLILQMEI